MACRSAPRSLVALLAFLVVGAAAAAQGEAAPGSDDPLASLEQQRALFREARAALLGGDLGAAASFLARAAAVSNPVPPPFSAAEDPRVAMRARSRGLWQRLARERRKSAAEASGKIRGQPCGLCDAIGVRACTTCDGRGSREERKGRRVVTVPCPPYELCSGCSGCGRRDGRCVEALIKLGAVVDRQKDGKDPVAALKAVVKAAGSLKVDTGGARVEYGGARRLQKLLGPLPRDLNRLPGDIRSELKAGWGTA